MSLYFDRTKSGHTSRAIELAHLMEEALKSERKCSYDTMERCWVHSRTRPGKCLFDRAREVLDRQREEVRRLKAASALRREEATRRGIKEP